MKLIMNNWIADKLGLKAKGFFFIIGLTKN